MPHLCGRALGRGVLIIDETGFLKKGTRSAGVARQYSGTGRELPDRCFPGLRQRKGPRPDRPRTVSAQGVDRERCTAVPEDIEFATKPRLAQRMIERALTAGVPVSWVLGDEV